MKTYMALDGLRWSRDSGSANCDMPRSAVFGRSGGGYSNLLIISLLTIVLTIYRLPVPSFCIWVVRVLAGVWMSISLCSMILRSSKIRGFLLPFSKYTYSIYLLSWFGQYAAKVLLINILHLHWSIAVVAMFICGIAVPLVVDKCVDRWFKDNKAIRLIIGY